MQPPAQRFDSSIIGAPGLVFQPMMKKHSPIIWISSEKSCFTDYADKISAFLRPYINDKSCSGKMCPVDILKDLGPCAVSPYGYDSLNITPCIYLKVNKVYKWRPDCHNNSQELPDNMPEGLKKYIKSWPKEDFNYVWVFCQGDHPVDREKIEHVEYYPLAGFDTDYFPATREKKHPLVAVRFLGISRGILITISCRTYAKNIPGNNQPLIFQLYLVSNEKHLNIKKP